MNQERQEAKRQIVDVLNVRKPDSKAFKSKFIVYNNEVTHENRIEVELLPNKNHQLLVKNYFASIKQKQLIKITEIYLEDRVIKIIDSFDSNNILPLPQPTKVKVVETPTISQTTKPIYSNRNLLEKRTKHANRELEVDEVRVRDTKNVVKNIFRMLQSWVQDKVSSQHKQELRQGLQALLSANGKYNNNLILSMTQNVQLRRAYLTFSQTQGSELIGSSKIHDKQSHLEALQRYRRICQKEQSVYIHEQRINEKRKSSYNKNGVYHNNCSNYENNRGSNKGSNSNSEGNGDANGGSDKDNKNPSSNSTNTTNTPNELAEQVS